MSSLTEAELNDMGLVSLAETFGLPASASGGIWLHRERSTGAMIRSPAGLIPTRRRKTREALAVLRRPGSDGIFFSGEALYAGPDMGTVEAALASGRETA